MRTFVLLAVLLAAFPAAAQTCRGPEGLPEPRVELPVEEGQFHRFPTKGLACVMPEDAGAAMYRSEAKITFLPCLKIGTVAVAADMDDVEEMLGPPARVMPLGSATEARAYFVAQRATPKPYYVVTYRQASVVGIQLVGPPPQLPIAFAGIRLGDRLERVIDALGLPSQRCDGPNGTEIWNWQPFPISIDMEDGVVKAIKVSWARK